jgi:hypothetical protein
MPRCCGAARSAAVTPLGWGSTGSTGATLTANVPTGTAPDHAKARNDHVIKTPQYVRSQDQAVARPSAAGHRRIATPSMTTDAQVWGLPSDTEPGQHEPCYATPIERFVRAADAGSLCPRVVPDLCQIGRSRPGSHGESRQVRSPHSSLDAGLVSAVPEISPGSVGVGGSSPLSSSRPLAPSGRPVSHGVSHRCSVRRPPARASILGRNNPVALYSTVVRP